jgi:hypothetical protein
MPGYLRNVFTVMPCAVALLAVVALAGCPGTLPPPSGPSRNDVVPDGADDTSDGDLGVPGVPAAQGLSNSLGRVTFADGDTGKNVTVQTLTQNGVAIPETRVQFFNSNRFGLFVAQDPAGTYGPAMTITPPTFSGSASVQATIRMRPPSTEAVFDLIDAGDPEADGARYLYSLAKANWSFAGVKTRAELLADTTSRLYVIGAFSPAIVAYYGTAAGRLTGIGDHFPQFNEPLRYKAYDIVSEPVTGLSAPIRVLAPLNERVEEPWLAGIWLVVIEGVQPAQYYMIHQLNADGTCVIEEYASGQYVGGANATWDLHPDASFVQTVSGGGMNGPYRGTRDLFYVEGVRGDGQPAVYHWVRIG